MGRKHEIDECLDTARAAVHRSNLAGAATQETRELRSAIRALIEAVEAVKRHHG